MSEEIPQTVEELEEAGFARACEVDALRDVMPTAAEIDGRTVLICRSGESIFAVDEICPHEDRSMRYGVIQGERIICPHHRYSFDLESGHCHRRRCAPVEVYETAVVDGTVWVRLDAEE